MEFFSLLVFPTAHVSRRSPILIFCFVFLLRKDRIGPGGHSCRAVHILFIYVHVYLSPRHSRCVQCCNQCFV